MQMPNPDDLENGIITEANRIAEQGAGENWSSEREWTTRLVLGLSELGHSQGFYVCGRGCRAFGQGEWLYDLLWLKLQNEKTGDIVDVPMILESEWSPRPVNIEEDFYKLLIGRAQHRVMIFQQSSAQALDKLTERFRQIIRTFSGTRDGDRYLFLGFNGADKKFTAESYVA
jgi:hypothetical protein